jgi:hypothetical protein
MELPVNASQIENINSTQASYLSYYEWLDILGFTELIDIFFGFLKPSLGLIGLLFNGILLIVLSDERFNERSIFKYLKLHVLCHVIICLSEILYITATRRYLNFNYYFASFVTCYICIPLTNIFNLCSSYINNLMLIERVCILHVCRKNDNFFIKGSPYKFCFCALLISVLVCLPSFFVLEPSSLTVDLNENLTYTFQFAQITGFYYTCFGQVLTTVYSTLKDSFSWDHFNLISAIIFKSYLAKKATLIGLGSNSIRPTQTNVPYTFSFASTPSCLLQLLALLTSTHIYPCFTCPIFTCLLWAS